MVAADPDVNELLNHSNAIVEKYTKMPCEIKLHPLRRGDILFTWNMLFPTKENRS